MLKKCTIIFLMAVCVLCIRSISIASLNKITGSGYILPDNLPSYKANFTIDVSMDGVNPPAGLVKYYYLKSRVNMVSTSISDLSILDTGKKGIITGTCKVNSVSGFSFTITVNDSSPDTYKIEIKRPDGQPYYSVGPKNVIGGSLTVTDTIPPAIIINSPQNLITVATSPIQVSGTIDDPTAIVTVNGVPASVSAGSFSVSGITISEGMNTIAAKAVDPANNMSTASVNISLDSTPPQVAINSPPDGYTTTADSIDATGIINDIVRGTVNENQGSVLVNGVTAEIANRNFTARSIPLFPGPNTIRADGSDQWGNLASNSITVNRDTTPRVTLNIESGNGQSGSIGSSLPNPLKVSLKKANNDPIANETVIFRVVDNNGTLYDTVSGNGMRIVAPLTDAAGKASASLTLGSWAGSGNNRVEVSATGVEGTVFFIASGMMKLPAAIYVAQGSQQRGAVSQLLPEPLVAFVTDEGHNPLKDVPVIFRVVEGGGHFTNGPDTLTTITINSDSDGRATVGFILGPTAGNDGNIMEAIFEGNTLPPASFTATGLIPGDPGNTRISGVVLDNSNNPVRNVTMKVEGTTKEALTDANGVFLISNVPVGPVHLIADGTTAGQPGILEYPTLMYELTTVSGADNKVSMPIYLVPLDLANSQEITGNETEDIIYTLDEVPGFSLTIKPGSATFPDGTKHGSISVTQVHADKVPMVPQIGQQPRFIVTIQPPGTVFDPPAPLTIPNVDGLAPGEKTNMYSFDHDLGVFVSIGTGTVSDDGLVIESDIGVGVVKAGWHCGGNPAPTGSANNCPQCKTCVNNVCVPSGSGSCTDDGNQCTSDICNNGSCTHPNSGGSCTDDGNVCTEDLCQGGGCSHPAKPDGTANFAECCFNGQVIQKSVSDIAILLSQCPARTQFTTRDHEIDGCSTPPIIAIITPGLSVQDPVGGHCGLASTVFGQPQPPFPHGSSPIDLPCNKHDVCYQTCGSTQAGCDQAMYNDMLTVCNTAYPTATCPAGLDPNLCLCYLNERADCFLWAGNYKVGLDIGGYDAWVQRQQQYCLCCP